MTYDEAQAAAAYDADTTGRPTAVYRTGRTFGILKLDDFAAKFNGPEQPHRALTWVEFPVGWRYVCSN